MESNIRTAEAWKEALAGAVRDPDELVDALGLPDEFREGARRAAARFGLVVPRGFLARMERGNPGDPLLLQVMPLAEELRSADGFVADPVGDGPAGRAPGLIVKYEGRALLVATGVCAVNCRYCFRREYPYDEVPAGREAWRPALDEIARDPAIREAILSGGDPLALTDAALERLVSALAAIPHLRVLRVHTRFPIVLPERVTPALTALLLATRLVPYVVVHANHPAELTGDTPAALARLVEAGIPLLNQSVLLAGVNDDPDVLAALSERLTELRVVPYYLHQLDPVRGAAQFHVPVERGSAIVEELRRRLPGYAVPRYVQEVAGEPGKVPLA